MLRVANVVMVVALLVTAGVVYHLKYASTSEAERLASLRVQIRKEREVIGRLKAEWARRTSPIYIQGLVQRHLDLKRLDVDSISDLSDLPERPQGSDDKIGGMIEALTDAPLVTSSVNRSAPAVAGAAGSAAPGVPAASALRQPSAPKPPAPPRPQTAQRTPAQAPVPAAPEPEPQPPKPPGLFDALAPLFPPGFLSGNR
ncbi:cell division protein FtsL [Xanthobacter tagetidis]|jgi:hypothetical protein|nr:hypothetical protein [Xanthobacter tagetidis]MBB6308668.1 hypothetical protein [Xanthobacter tagetidis]